MLQHLLLVPVESRRRPRGCTIVSKNVPCVNQPTNQPARGGDPRLEGAATRQFVGRAAEILGDLRGPDAFSMKESEVITLVKKRKMTAISRSAHIHARLYSSSFEPLMFTPQGQPTNQLAEARDPAAVRVPEITYFKLPLGRCVVCAD